MIVDLLFSVMLGILNALLGLIPAFEPWNVATCQVDPTGQAFAGGCDVGAGAGHVGHFLYVWDKFVPVAFLFGALVAVLATRVFIAVVEFVRWIWSVLPFKAS